MKMVNDSGMRNESGAVNRMAIALATGGSLLRVLSYFFSDNSGGDAAARVGITAQWLQQPDFRLAFGAYGPGHFWLIGLFSLFLPNITTAGRLLSLVLGIASIFLVWKLTQRLYGDAAAILALAIFSFYSLHIGYSSTSSAEVPFLFLLLASLYFFFTYLQLNQTWRLAVAGLFLSVAESMRYEAWVFFFAMSVALIGLVVLTNGKVQLGWSQLKPLLVFGCTGALWPTLAMVGSWRAYGDPMRSLTVHNELVTGWFGAHPVPLAHQVIVIPAALLIGLSPIGIVGALFGLFKSFSGRLTAAYTGVVLFFWAVQNYEILSGKLLAMARYSLTLGALLAIVAGFGLQKICIHFWPRRLLAAEGTVILLLLLNLTLVFVMSERHTRYADKFAPLSPRLRYSRRIAEVGRYLKSHMQAGDKIVIDDYNVESNLVAQAAGLPVLPRNQAYLASAKNEVGVREYIASQRPRFLVYSDEGTLRQTLALPPGCLAPVSIDGIRFACEFSTRIYRVYEMSYP